MGDDNVRDMWQLVHSLPCPACGSALTVDVDGGALTLGPLSHEPEHDRRCDDPGASALEQAWARFVAGSARLDD